MILLIGPSGSGKSTLMRCINGLVPHFSGGEISGNVRVQGLDPVTATPQILSRHVGFVFQDPESQFVMDRVEDEVAFALENAAMAPQEMRVRVEETLDLLDLAPLRERLLSTLSGGERQRVAIAAALALRPEILVLDEPTSQLDPKSAEDVLNALVRLNSDLGLTILLAEHRMERVLPYVDRVVYLPDDGSPILSDAPRTVLNQIELGPPLVKLGRALQWQPLPLTIKEGLRFSRTWLEKQPNRPAPALRPQPERSAQAPFIQVRGLTVHYGRTAVVRQMDLELFPGEIVALMGRNGSN
jgi:energy-coupling factor transport system ATP-binding protein